MSVLATVATAVWAMLPAYLPNNVAVLAGGGRPIDGGHKWGGRRLLGDGKTWRGTLAGTGAGLALALVLSALQPVLADTSGIDLPGFSPSAGLGLAAGAMAGDLAASFLKRRAGRERGAAVPVLDQLDFVAGALALAFVLAPDWFVQTVTPPVLGAVVLVTPVLHVGTNAIAYALGLKDEPW